VADGFSEATTVVFSAVGSVGSDGVTGLTSDFIIPHHSLFSTPHSPLSSVKITGPFSLQHGKSNNLH